MLTIQCITIDCQDPIALATIWAQVLDWKIGEGATHDEAYIEKSPDSSRGENYPDLLFIRTPDTKKSKNRIHLDLRPKNQLTEVERLVKIGAKRIEIGQSVDPDTTWIVMADPEGNEFCVLKPLD